MLTDPPSAPSASTPPAQDIQSQPQPHSQTNGHTITPPPPPPLSQPTSRTTNVERNLDIEIFPRTYYYPPNVVPPAYRPNGARSLCGISFRAFALGLTCGVCLNLAVLLGYIDVYQSAAAAAEASHATSQPASLSDGVDGVYSVGYLWRLPFFVATLSLFHYLEFDMTARYNTSDAKISSFLLFNNGWAYTVAHSLAMVECLVRWFMFSRFVPEWSGQSLAFGSVAASWSQYLLRLTGLESIIDVQSASSANVVVRSGGAFSFVPPWAFILLGLGLVVVGQTLRSLAMKTAGKSFNHIVQSTKQTDHVLVTDGIYRWSRHPSYLGFFWWGLGTQVVLGNYVCLVLYAAVLWKFFATRITHEEKHLITFFGTAYLEYKEHTPVLIPFIR